MGGERGGETERRSQCELGKPGFPGGEPELHRVMGDRAAPQRFRMVDAGRESTMISRGTDQYLPYLIVPRVITRHE